MGHHAAQFIFGHRAQETLCRTHHSVTWVAPSSKSVGLIIWGDGNSRHRHSGAGGQFLHHSEKEGGIFFGHNAGFGTFEGKFVAEPVRAAHHDKSNEKTKGQRTGTSSAQDTCNGDNETSEPSQQNRGFDGVLKNEHYLSTGVSELTQLLRRKSLPPKLGDRAGHK